MAYNNYPGTRGAAGGSGGGSSNEAQNNEKTVDELRKNREQQYVDARKANWEFLQNLEEKGIIKLEKLNLQSLGRLEDIKERYAAKEVDVKKQLLNERAMDEKEFNKSLQKMTDEQQKQAIAKRNSLLQKEHDVEMALEKQKQEEIKKTQAENYTKNIKNAKSIYLTNQQLNRKALQEKLKAIANDKKLSAKEKADKTKEAIKESHEKSKRFKAELKENRNTAIQNMKDAGMSNKEIKESLKESTTTALKERAENGDNLAKTQLMLADAIADLRKQFDTSIENFQQYQAKVNVRLQGSGQTWQSSLGEGIEYKLQNAIGMTNPWVKLTDVFNNVVTATEQGIAFNVEQRSFLETIKDKIAATFNAFDASLLRIIKLQQADSTAARLGMESALTQFLNGEFQDSSYMSSLSKTVTGNLMEATSQMSADAAVGFEYQVQKWMGSLSSVGFSDSAVSAISQAIGQLGSGDVEGLASNSAMQNLIVMAASRIGKSYSEMLINGLDSETTNELLESMVNYLKEIANSNNKVVKSQYAKIFGMSISDLTAVANLSSDISTIAKNSMDYQGAMSHLANEMSFGNMFTRVGVAGMLGNVKDNFMNGIAANISANPALYGLYTITNAVEDLTDNGLTIPNIGVMGNFADMGVSITQMMRLGIVGAGLLSGIGGIVNSIGSTASPSNMLTALGIDGSKIATTRRGGVVAQNSRRQVSQSALMGNSSSSDIYDSTLTSANDQKAAMLKNEQEKSTDITLNNIHEYLLRIFDPKITLIAQAAAAMSGISTKTSNWGSFSVSGDQNLTYGAQSMVIDSTAKTTSSQWDELRSMNTTLTGLLTACKNFFDRVSDSTGAVKITGNVTMATTAIGLTR